MILKQMLHEKSTAIIGLGALGSIASKLCADTGIGTLILIDHDILQQSNLQRQPFYSKEDINKLKCAAAAEKLKNKAIIVQKPIHIDAQTIKSIKADIILDCTDNFETRFIIDEHCKKNNIPWVHAAAAGTICVILPITDDYCLRCVYKNAADGLTCDDIGIENETAQQAARIQVDEAIKILASKPHTHGLLRCNGKACNVLKIRQKCSNHKPKEMQRQFIFTLAKCTTRAGFSAKPSKNIKLNLKKIKSNFTTLIETPIVLVIKEADMEIIVHEYGELLFKNGTDEGKMNHIAEEIYGIGA